MVLIVKIGFLLGDHAVQLNSMELEFSREFLFTTTASLFPSANH